MSKAVDKVLHEVLFYKSCHIDISLILLDFSSHRKQRVILNREHLSWINLEARAPGIYSWTINLSEL